MRLVSEAVEEEGSADMMACYLGLCKDKGMKGVVIVMELDATNKAEVIVAVQAS